MSPELVIEGLAFARGLGSSPLLGFVDCVVFETARGRERVLPDFAVGPHVRRVDALWQMAGRGPVRLYIPTAPHEHARTVVQAKEWFGRRASIVYSDEKGLEIMEPGTNKGQALRTVASAMRIDRTRVAAIGDGPNDREMLEYAGRSAVPVPPPGTPLMRSLILGSATQVFRSSAGDGAIEALRCFFPPTRLMPRRPDPTLLWTGPDGSARRPEPPDMDHDPEPDMDLTAA